MSCVVLAAIVTVAAVPAPGNAQIGKLLKKAVKAKVANTAIDKAGVQPAAPDANRATRASAQPGPRFTENVLEITPELLDRFEKGLAAETSVQDEIDRLIGKLLSPDEYERCSQAAMRTPEAQKIYMAASDLINGDTTLEHIQKASEEMARRFDRIVRPKCGLDTQDAQKVRDQHADRLEEAGPAASGLTKLQVYLLKERIIPFCTAAQALAAAGGEVRIPTSAQEIFWVYTPAEVEALQPRCARLATAMRRRG